MDILLKVMFQDLKICWKKNYEEQNCDKKLTLCFKSTADASINESVNDSNDFYQTLQEATLPLRQMIAKPSNNLDDNTMNNIEQINSIPINLHALVSMLSDGPGVSNR